MQRLLPGGPASGQAAGLLELKVKAKDGSEHNYRYLIRLTGGKGHGGGGQQEGSQGDDQED